jgi:hypothetical protein
LYWRINVSLRDWLRNGWLIEHLGCFSHIVTMKKEIDNLDFHGML